MHKKLFDVAVNPSHFLWDILITHYNYPFIKRELLLNNPARILNIESWEFLLKQLTGYDTNLIISNLKRISKLTFQN